jgi:hypothetical protein
MERLQFLTRFKPHRFPRWNGYFRSRPWIPADAGFTRPNVKDAEASQLDPIALAKSLLHGFENRLDSHFSLGFCDSRPVHYLVDNIQLNQAASDLVISIDRYRLRGVAILMIRRKLARCQ